MRMFFQIYNRMNIHYLPIYVPDDAEKADAQLFADNVRNEMCKAMQACPGFPGTIMTEHAYEDTRLLAKAQKMYKKSNPRVTTAMPYSEIREQHNFSIEQTLQLLENFSKADTNGDGLISKEEFAAHMGLDPECPTTDAYFSIMDPEGHGSVKFRAFLQGVTVGNDKMDQEEKVKVVFRIYDVDNSGDVTKEELMQIMESHQSLAHSESPSEIADRIMEGRKGLDYAAFHSAVEQYPELMTFALERVEKWYQKEEIVATAVADRTLTA